MSTEDIVTRACEEPVRQIVGNAGHEGAIIIEKIRGNNDPNYGFNAASMQFEDLVKAGVIDPTKVTRSALQNASSNRGADAHDGSHDRRDSGEEVGSGGWSWRAWAGDGLLSHVVRRQKSEETRSEKAGLSIGAEQLYLMSIGKSERRRAQYVGCWK
jgi:hypothetical protein